MPFYLALYRPSGPVALNVEHFAIQKVVGQVSPRLLSAKQPENEGKGGREEHAGAVSVRPPFARRVALARSKRL